MTAGTTILEAHEKREICPNEERGRRSNSRGREITNLPRGEITQLTHKFSLYPLQLVLIPDKGYGFVESSFTLVVVDGVTQLESIKVHEEIGQSACCV